MTDAWFSSEASACRKYSWLMTGPFAVVDWKFITK